MVVFFKCGVLILVNLLMVCFRYLHAVLCKNQNVTDQNRNLLVETLRSISEILIWGDQNDSTVFEYVPDYIYKSGHFTTCVIILWYVLFSIILIILMLPNHTLLFRGSVLQCSVGYIRNLFFTCLFICTELLS